MGVRVPPLKIKTLLESNPLKSTILVRRLAVVNPGSEESRMRLGPFLESYRVGSYRNIVSMYWKQRLVMYCTPAVYCTVNVLYMVVSYRALHVYIVSDVYCYHECDYDCCHYVTIDTFHFTDSKPAGCPLSFMGEIGVSQPK